MRPGSTVSARALISFLQAGSSGPMAAIAPSSMAISLEAQRSTRSNIAYKPETNVHGSVNILRNDRFIGVVAQPSGTAQKKHGGGNSGGEDHRVVPGAAHH